MTLGDADDADADAGAGWGVEFDVTVSGDDAMVLLLLLLTQLLCCSAAAADLCLGMGIAPVTRCVASSACPTNR